MPSFDRIHAAQGTGFGLILGLLMLMAASKAVLFDTMDPDAFWHLQVAEQIRNLGVGQLRDTITFGSGAAVWTPYSWLAELFMLKVWEITGWRGAVAVTSLASALFVGLCGCWAYVRAQSATSHRTGNHDPSMSAAVGTMVAFLLSMPYLSFRPVTFCLVIIASCGFLASLDRWNRTRAVWLIPPLCVLGTNLHFFVILVPLGLAANLLSDLLQGQPARRGMLLLTATVLACLCTPLLHGVAHSVLHYSLNDPMVNSGIIAEFEPFYSGKAGLLSAAVVLGGLFMLLRRRERFEAGEWLLLGGALVLAASKGRFSPVLAMALAPMIAAAVDLSGRTLQRPLPRVAMAATLLLGLLTTATRFPGKEMSLENWLNRRGIDLEGYPTAAVRFVQSEIEPRTGRVINEFNWGGYIGWALRGRFVPLLDGRTQVHSAELWQATYLGESPDAVWLGAQEADAAILPANNSRFRHALTGLGWQIAHADARAVVMVPASTPLAGAAE
jgi:hypothetical protein